MKIAILSDSHDNLDNLRRAIDIIKQRKVHEVIHLGDFVNPNMIGAFSGSGLHVTGILGNNDGEIMGLSKAFSEVDGNLAGHFYKTTLERRKTACYHGTVKELKDALISSKKYDIVFYGHDHTALDEVIDNVHAINPGTVHGFGGRASFVIYDPVEDKAEFVDIEQHNR